MVDESEQTPAGMVQGELGGESGPPVAAAPRRRRRAASRPAGPPVATEATEGSAEQGHLFESAAQDAAITSPHTDTSQDPVVRAGELQAPGGESPDDETSGVGEGADTESAGDDSDQDARQAADADEARATEAVPDVAAAPGDTEPVVAAVVRKSRRATRGVTTVAFSAVPEAEPTAVAAIAAPPEVPAIRAVFQAPDETRAVRRRRPRADRSSAGAEAEPAAPAATVTDGSEPEAVQVAQDAAEPKRPTRSRRSRSSRATQAPAVEGSETEPTQDEAEEGSREAVDRPDRDEDGTVRRPDQTEHETDTDTDIDEAEDSAEGSDNDREDDGAPRRRRRRGGRRRRRPGTGGADEADGSDSSGSQASDEDVSDDTAGRTDRSDDTTGRTDRSDDTAGRTDRSDAESDDSDSNADEGDSPSARRRRRRRRKAGVAEEMEDLSSEDPPNTVVKVREARRPNDEITSLRGSTRIEAKKQRRRDGREAGRRRAPILTEAEFLARRESVNRVMCVREHGDRTQIAVLEDGILVEHYVNRAESSSLVGNVYLGKVQNVLPSMEAAFVDIGRGRNAVLYAGEVNWDAAGMEGQPKRIELALKSGDPVLVQVTKDPIGHKGARLTSQISLPGRFLVYVPEGSMTGISRKLPDTERSRLKGILRDVVPAGAGVIVRTAAEGASEEQLTSDVQRLSAQWKDIGKKSKSASAPALLYGEPDLAIKVVRDIFNEDFTTLLVQGDSTWGTLREYIGWVAPDLAPKMDKWVQSGDLFAAHRIDEQLAKALDRKVWLPSGGSLVIDRTEAMTVVDVNTGKFTGQGGNLEETVTKNNLEAAEEIVRQLRLRDIGGIIVVDFIDMVLESNRDLVLRRLVECLGRDRTKHQVAEVTSLGLVQMTRKRIGQGLLEVFSTQCEHCGGRGHLVSTEPVGSPDAPGEESSGGNRRERGGRRGGGNGHGNGGGNGGGARQQSMAGLGGRQTGKTPPPPKFDEHGHIDHSDPAHDEHADHDADDEVEVEVGVEPGELASVVENDDEVAAAQEATAADVVVPVDHESDAEGADVRLAQDQADLIHAEALAEGIVEAPEDGAIVTEVQPEPEEGPAASQEPTEQAESDDPTRAAEAEVPTPDSEVDSEAEEPTPDDESHAAADGEEDQSTAV